MNAELRRIAAWLLRQAEQEWRWAEASGPEHREGYVASARAKARAAFALWRRTV